MHNRFNLRNLFFSSSYSAGDARNLLPKHFVEYKTQTNAFQVKQLAMIQKAKTDEMHSQYCSLLTKRFQGQIVYTLSTHSPDKMLAAGGLKKTNQTVWLNERSGNNTGCICFSLLPEITAIFYRQFHKLTYFIYAVALKDEIDYILPGTKWREIISPGAFPIAADDFFIARQIVESKNNGQILLGPMIGRKGNESFIQGEHFDKFCLNQLVLPEAINCGDDYPLEFQIIDTPKTKQFQNDVECYHRVSQKAGYIVKPS